MFAFSRYFYSYNPNPPQGILLKNRTGENKKAKIQSRERGKHTNMFQKLLSHYNGFCRLDQVMPAACTEGRGRKSPGPGTAAVIQEGAPIPTVPPLQVCKTECLSPQHPSGSFLIKCPAFILWAYRGN